LIIAGFSLYYITYSSIDIILITGRQPFTPEHIDYSRFTPLAFSLPARDAITPDIYAISRFLIAIASWPPYGHY